MKGKHMSNDCTIFRPLWEASINPRVLEGRNYVLCVYLSPAWSPLPAIISSQ